MWNCYWMFFDHHYKEGNGLSNHRSAMALCKWVERREIELLLLHSDVPLTKNWVLLTQKCSFTLYPVFYSTGTVQMLVVQEHAILFDTIVISATLFTDASYCFMWKLALLSSLFSVVTVNAPQVFFLVNSNLLCSVISPRIYLLCCYCNYCIFTLK